MIFNRDHEEIFKLCLAIKEQNQLSQHCFNKVVEQLLQHGRSHFKREMDQFHALNYPKLYAHHCSHENMLAKFSQLSGLPANDHSRQKILTTLDILIRHINNEDQEAQIFFRNQLGTAATLGEMLRNIQSELPPNLLSVISEDKILEIIESNFCDFTMNRLTAALRKIRQGDDPVRVIHEVACAFRSKKIRKAG